MQVRVHSHKHECESKYPFTGSSVQLYEQFLRRSCFYSNRAIRLSIDTLSCACTSDLIKED